MTDLATADLRPVIAEDCRYRLNDLALELCLDEEHRCKEVGLVPWYLTLLRVISCQPGLAVHQLASFFQESRNDVDADLATLERLEMVRRRNSGQHSLVSLTMKGSAALQMVARAREEIVASRFQMLSLSDLQQFHQLLERLTDDRCPGDASG